MRNPDEVARSYSSLPQAYRRGLLTKPSDDPVPAVRDMIDTINSNIRHFLKDKPSVMAFRLRVGNN